MPDARAMSKQKVFKEVNFNRETQETLKPIIIRDARDRECNFNDTWIDIFFFYSYLFRIVPRLLFPFLLCILSFTIFPALLVPIEFFFL